MADASHLESLSRVDDVITPPAALRQVAYLQNLDETQQQSIEHNEAFWAQVAGELEWFRPWDQVFEWHYPRFRWFVGAQCNITVNALDRHVNSWRKNKVAFVWIGEDGSEVTLSYGQLLRRVNRVANRELSRVDEPKNVAGIGRLDRLPIAAKEPVRARCSQRLPHPAVVERHVLFETPRADAHKGDAIAMPGVHVRLNLEHKPAEAIVRGVHQP